MTLHPPLQHTKFSLDVSGIAGFFGGEESFAAMSSVHLMRGRRWMGWYNSPGSYYVAKKYGTLAKSRLWSGLFPGPSVEPAEMLELDSKSGPRYMGVYSGTRLSTTGHLSYLISRHCDLKVKPQSPPSPLADDRSPNDSPEPGSKPFKGQGGQEKKQRTKISITIVELEDQKKWEGYPIIPDEYFLAFDPLGLIATVFTIAGGVMAALWGDWYSFAMIFLGAVSNGVSCYVLGSGILELDSPVPSPNSPPGDGMLISTRDIIILKGNEQSVSNVIRGRYHLHYNSHPKYRNIGWSSVILISQFLLQLFLVPQGVLIGQIMFLATFIVSWGFNAYLASVDRETLQTDVLLKILGQPRIRKFTVDKWSTAAVFATFYLQPKEPESVINELMPNSTPAWNAWKKRIVEAILQKCEPSKVPEPDDIKLRIDDLEPSGQKFVHEFLERADKAWLGAHSMLNSPLPPMSPVSPMPRIFSEKTQATLVGVERADSWGKKKGRGSFTSFYSKKQRTPSPGPQSDSPC